MDFTQLIGSVIPFFERLPIIRAMLGFLLVFFIPGFAWTLILFNQISVMERIALSFGLSIAMVTLSILALNRLGIRVTGTNSLLIIMVMIAIALGIYSLKRFMVRRQERD